MKDTSGGYIGVSKITVLETLEPGVWYEAWRCSECNRLLALDGMRRPGPGPIVPAKPDTYQVRIACPGCKADRLYPINAREVVQAPPA